MYTQKCIKTNIKSGKQQGVSQWQKRTVPEPYYGAVYLYPPACPVIKIMTNIIGTS
jgi:hypothetical protein